VQHRSYEAVQVGALVSVVVLRLGLEAQHKRSTIL
jgi:hypothetical protein